MSVKEAESGTDSKQLAPGDERVRQVSTVNRLLSRPELGSVSGAILVFAFFALVAWDSGMFNADGVVNWTVVSAQLGIIAWVPVY
nr:hypothetical protein [Enterovibrio nigricans]